MRRGDAAPPQRAVRVWAGVPARPSRVVTANARPPADLENRRGGLTGMDGHGFIDQRPGPGADPSGVSTNHTGRPRRESRPCEGHRTPTSSGPDTPPDLQAGRRFRADGLELGSARLTPRKAPGVCAGLTARRGGAGAARCLVPGPSPAAAVRAVAGGDDELDLLDHRPEHEGSPNRSSRSDRATASTSVTVEPGLAPLAPVPAWDQLAQPADVLALPVFSRLVCCSLLALLSNSTPRRSSKAVGAPRHPAGHAVSRQSRRRVAGRGRRGDRVRGVGDPGLRIRDPADHRRGPPGDRGNADPPGAAQPGGAHRVDRPGRCGAVARARPTVAPARWPWRWGRPRRPRRGPSSQPARCA
ncbi:MAG: hypothetical protein JWR81_3811 [Pseudonocardia sp.]|nr:hypothetical protein [Pseudonocardia sp.]